MAGGEVEKVKEALKTDFPFYAETCLKVENNGRQVPFVLRPAQLRLWEELQARKDLGKPMWAIVLKSRRQGFSTMVQGMLLQRVTQRFNHTALTVAQSGETAGELFGKGEQMWQQLPTGDGWDELMLKPVQKYTKRSREIVFGEPSRSRSQQGHLGLNSKLVADTAGEFEGKRGFTAHDLHLSELAFWPNITKKYTALINTIPTDFEDSLVVVECTANGFNEFKELWDQAEAGKSDFLAFFSPWFEDPSCVRRCESEEDFADEFGDPIGVGPYGEDEPVLLELGCTLQQLAWRRWAINTKANGDLSQFNQEYPQSPAHAFKSTGRNVFAPALTSGVVERCRSITPELVTLKATQHVLKTTRHQSFQVPAKVEIAEQLDRSRAQWSVYARPEEGRQYVVTVDPASGEENTAADPDFSVIQVIDHKSRVQVAEYATREDADVVADQAFMACLLYAQRPHKPLLVVEMTGGYGRSIVNRVRRDYGYGHVYRRRNNDPSLRKRESDLLGFSTDRATKSELIDGMAEILRDRKDGIRSIDLAHELEGYTRHKNGRTGARSNGHDDRLMAYMIGQFVCQERPPRPDKKVGVVDTATRMVRNARASY